MQLELGQLNQTSYNFVFRHSTQFFLSVCHNFCFVRQQQTVVILMFICHSRYRILVNNICLDDQKENWKKYHGQYIKTGIPQFLNVNQNPSTIIGPHILIPSSKNFYSMFTCLLLLLPPLLDPPRAYPLLLHLNSKQKQRFYDNKWKYMQKLLNKGV